MSDANIKKKYIKKLNFFKFRNNDNNKNNTENNKNNTDKKIFYLLTILVIILLIIVIFVFFYYIKKNSDNNIIQNNIPEVSPQEYTTNQYQSLITTESEYINNNQSTLEVFPIISDIVICVSFFLVLLFSSDKCKINYMRSVC